MSRLDDLESLKTPYFKLGSVSLNILQAFTMELVFEPLPRLIPSQVYTTILIGDGIPPSLVSNGHSSRKEHTIDFTPSFFIRFTFGTNSLLGTSSKLGQLSSP